MTSTNAASLATRIEMRIGELLPSIRLDKGNRILFCFICSMRLFRIHFYKYPRGLGKFECTTLRLSLKVDIGIQNWVEIQQKDFRKIFQSLKCYHDRVGNSNSGLKNSSFEENYFGKRAWGN